MGLGLCAATASAVDRTLFRESFVPVPVDLSVDRRMDAYVPLYRRIQPLILRTRPISPIDLRSIADEWIELSQNGQLLPIEASFHGENMDESPKGQLVEGTMRFAIQLTEVAQAELENGLVNDAVADSIRAAAVLDSVRFASPATMMMTATVIRRPLNLAATNISRVKTLPAILVKQLEISRGANDRYIECLKRSERQELIYTVRYGNINADEEDQIDFRGSKKTGAQRFYGLDRENALAQNAKACKFVTSSESK